jgi:tRNA pseudouridine38-40 synthase
MTEPSAESDPGPLHETGLERTFRLVLEYDGSRFEGWQTQASERSPRTVQGVLESELIVFSPSGVRVRGAGRTDAGVHAMAQVASVRTTSRLDAESLLRALNARLPKDLAVRALTEVAAGWDALREACGKHYRYQIWNGSRRSPLRATRFVWVAERLDVKVMRRAAECLVGRHDFAAFQGAGSDTKTTVRTLTSIELSGAPSDEILIDVQGEGFLRHMVRNLAGTLIEVGRGRWQPERMSKILASRDRAEAGPTAPAPGLMLVGVRDSWSEGTIGGSEAPDSVDDGHPVG